MYERDKTKLETALRLYPEKSTFNFASGNIVTNNHSGNNVPTVFCVKGVGRISIPVSMKNVGKLKSFAENSPIGGNGFTNASKNVSSWQIDILKMVLPASQPFFVTTVPKLASSFVSSLMGCAIEHLDIEFQLEKVLLFGCGGPFYPNSTTSIVNGVFSQMVLQIPVQNGCEGGQLKVTEPAGNHKSFDFSQESPHYFMTVFLANCRYELGPITKGWTLLMTFNLIWKTPLPMPPVSSLPVFIKALTEAEEVLDGWVSCEEVEEIEVLTDDDEIVCLTGLASSGYCNSDGNPPSTARPSEDFLFFPLDHKYSREHLSFSNLRGRDRFLNGVLQSIKNIDVYLALIDDQVTSNRFLKIQNAVCAAGSLPRNEFHLDIKSQLIGNITLILERAKQRPTTNECELHRHAILIIQSRLQSVRAICLNKFDTILDHLENSLVSSGVCQLTRRKLIETLDQVISFCRINPLQVWKDSCSRTKRLLNICGNLQAKEAGLALLDLLCTDFEFDGKGKVTDSHQATVKKLPAVPDQNVENKAPQRQQIDSIAASADDDEAFSDEELSEEDGTELCCSCCEPIGEQFASSCDRCLSWNHGECVGVTPELAEELDNKKLEWICPNCVRQDTVKLAEAQQPSITQNLPSATTATGQTESSLFYEGVRDEDIAEAIVEFLCKVGGWKDCAESILRLISPTRLSKQFTSLICLVRQLLHRSIYEGAAHTANRLASLLSKQDKAVELDQLQIKACVNLMMDLEENTITANQKRLMVVVAFIKQLKPFQQCQLVIDLQERDTIHSVPTCQEFYQNVCLLVLRCNIDDTRRFAEMVVDLVKCFQSLEDQSLLRRFLKKLCFVQDSVDLVKPLLSSPRIWKQTAILDMISSTYLGHVTLISFVNSLIAQLKCRDGRTEEGFMDDLLSCVFLAFYVMLEHFQLKDSTQLESMSGIYAKLSNDGLFQLVQNIIKIVEEQKPSDNKSCSHHPLVELFQELLKRNGSSKSEQAPCLVAQLMTLVLRRQDRVQFHKLVNLLVKFDFVSASWDLSIFKTILSLMDISKYVDPEWSKSYYLLLETWIINVRLTLKRKNTRSCIADCVLMFIWTEENLDTLKFDALDSYVNLYHLMFADMSTFQLGQLVTDIYESQSERLKQLPISLDLFECLCHLFVARDLKLLVRTVSNVLISVLKALLWLDIDSIVMSFCGQICSVSPFGTDISTVKQIVFSAEIRQLVESSGSSRNRDAFFLLLEQRIGYLRLATKAEYSWSRPDAVFPDCREVQQFLRSPLERLTYHRKRKGSEDIVTELKANGCSVQMLVSNKAKVTCIILKNKFYEQPTGSQHGPAKAELGQLIALRQRMESGEPSTPTVPDHTYCLPITADSAIKSKLNQMCCRLDQIDCVASSSASNEFLRDQLDEDIANCVGMYVRNEKERLGSLKHSIELFSPLFQKMSTWRLAHLLVKLYTADSSQQPNETPTFYRHIAQQFADRDIQDLVKMTSDVVVDFVVDVMTCLIWLGDRKSVLSFSRKICDSFPSGQENPIVNKMVMSSKLRKMAATSQCSRTAFCRLLMQSITRLKMLKAQSANQPSKSASKDSVGTCCVENKLKEMDVLLRSLQEKSESEGFFADLTSVEDDNAVPVSPAKRVRLASF